MAEPLFAVCVVDDDASVRTSTVRLLRELGYPAEAFDSAAAFLRRAPCSESCRLLLDVSMPTMDGLALARELQRDGRRERVVFMSADGTEGIRRRIAEFGAIELVRKPFVVEELIGALIHAQPLPPP